MKLQESLEYVPAFVCVVFSVTVPTVAPISPFTPAIDVMVAVSGRPLYVATYGVTTTVAVALLMMPALLETSVTL